MGALSETVQLLLEAVVGAGEPRSVGGDSVSGLRFRAEGFKV